MTKRPAAIQRRGLLVETVPLSSLREDPRNARKHGEANLKAIANSLRHHGQVEPLVVQKSTGLILGGNGRLAAMKTLGWKTAQVVRIDIEGARARALALALNRTAEIAEWEFKTLADTLQEIDTGEFDVAELTGFDAAELERIANWAPNDLRPMKDLPPPRMAWVLVGCHIENYGPIESVVNAVSDIPGVIIRSTLTNENRQFESVVEVETSISLPEKVSPKRGARSRSVRRKRPSLGQSSSTASRGKIPGDRSEAQGGENLL